MRVLENMKKLMMYLAGFFVLGLIIQAFEGDKKSFTPSAGSNGLNSDPACVALRAKMSAPDAAQTITVEDLTLSQRCATN